ncbi:TetR/AcrR family transcriptional regulator [Caulobacter sp. RL271]|jgi:AcrR family transcriptional regulator|uniref:TetR/AcrR family transcriptional regulator n=1 Tax=Caulobacter segnis TaxID=88688 RepID=A0ABY4ZRC0_9CAUL|nr:TetR/AcrR family transcriptional regulator [Caulobacter segnis]USQ95205.1 TetR/AcrR family transcriptional regulator [Caulobacter segnis]
MTSPSRPSRNERRRALTRERLIASASELFGRVGVRAVRVDDIAAAAGVTKPTLYRHFQGKEDLVIACVRAEGLRARSDMAASVEAVGPAPARRALAIARHFAELFAQVPCRGLLIVDLAAEHFDPGDPVLEATRLELEALQEAMVALLSPARPAWARAAASRLALAVYGASAVCRVLAPAVCETLIDQARAIPLDREATSVAS